MARWMPQKDPYSYRSTFILDTLRTRAKKGQWMPYFRTISVRVNFALDVGLQVLEAYDADEIGDAEIQSLIAIAIACPIKLRPDNEAIFYASKNLRRTSGPYRYSPVEVLELLRTRAMRARWMPYLEGYAQRINFALDVGLQVLEAYEDGLIGGADMQRIIAAMATSPIKLKRPEND